MTKILFLDTETSALTPTQGQIIEIAGIIANFNKDTLKLETISQFSQTIKTQTPIDDKITRLTGIKQEELDTSPSKTTVQQKWLKWLEEYESVSLIVGHSIDFDINFLKSEGWYLPENAHTVDTLDLSKIFLNTQQGINLEFLIQSLSLEKYVKEMDSNFETKQSAHRALYDTHFCAALYAYFIDLSAKLPIDKNFLNIIKENFLHLNFQTYQKSELSKIEKATGNDKIYINSIGQNQDRSLNSYLNKYSNKLNKTSIHSLHQLIINIEDKNLTKPLLGLYLSYLWIELGYKGRFYSHAYTSTEKILLKTFIEENLKPKDEKSSESIMKEPESIIQDIDKIYYQTMNLTKVEGILEIIENHNNASKEIKSLAQKILSSISFFQITIQKRTNYGKFNYKPFDLDIEDYIVKSRLAELSKYLNKALQYQPNDQDSNTVRLYINMMQRDLFTLSPDNNYLFQDFAGTLSISQEKEFNIASHFQNLANEYNNLSVETYLPERLYESLKQIAQIKIDCPVKHLVNDQELINNISYDENLTQFLSKKIAESKDANKNVLILTNRNNTLEDLERSLTKNFTKSEYLIIGESGSLKKIISKVLSGHKGIIIIKSKDFEYFYNSTKIDILETCSVQRPFIYLSKYWIKNLNSDQEKNLTYIYQSTLWAKIFHYTNKKINILESYTK